MNCRFPADYDMK